VINFRYIMSDFVDSNHFSKSSSTDNMSIVDVCYQAINDTFSYGSYLGFKVIINTKTGFVNATKLCDTYGKHYYHWTQNKQTKDLITTFNTQQHSDQDGWQQDVKDRSARPPGSASGAG